MNDELPPTQETCAVSCLTTSAHCPSQFTFIRGLWKTLVESSVGLRAAGIAMPGIFFCSILHFENKQILFGLKKKRQLCKIFSELGIRLWFNHLRTNEIFCWEVVLYVFVLLVLVQ